MQAGLTGIRRTQKTKLRGALGSHDVRRSATAPALLRAREFLRQLLDAGLDVGLQMIRSLVLGNGPQHLLEAGQAVLRLTRVAVSLLGFLVFG